VYKTDKTYDIENDELNHRQGIYIVHTTNEYLQSVLVKMRDIPIETYVSTPYVTKSDFISLQQQNLNNVDVASCIHPDGMTNMGAPIASSRKYTGLNHYNELNLSTILELFGKIGIKHVNIIDLSCRVFMDAPPPNELQRQLSQEELKHGNIMLNLLKDRPKDGGTKRRRKRTRKAKSKKNNIRLYG
jgi:hypothetical protein